MLFIKRPYTNIFKSTITIEYYTSARREMTSATVWVAIVETTIWLRDVIDADDVFFWAIYICQHCVVWSNINNLILTRLIFSTSPISLISSRPELGNSESPTKHGNCHNFVTSRVVSIYQKFMWYFSFHHMGKVEKWERLIFWWNGI